MAKKTQSTAMKAAYGNRFSQQDYTNPVEHLEPTPLKDEGYQEGDLKFAREHMMVTPAMVNRNVPRSTVSKTTPVR